jgi:hypothetical protein
MGNDAVKITATRAGVQEARVSNQIFLNAVFPSLPDNARALTCAFPGDPVDGKWWPQPWRPGMATFHLRSGTNNYVCISSFYPDPATGQYRRRKAQFAQMHALMVDDINTKVPQQKIRLPLSALVETSPGNYQGWYFLRKSPGACDFTVVDAVLKAMIASGLTADGTDPGMAGVTRVGRLPVGCNGKRKYVDRLGHPFQCRAVDWRPERRYTLEEVAKAYKLDTDTHQQRTRASGAPSMTLAKLPRGEATARVQAFERMLKTLADNGMYLGARGPWHDIECPWVDQHTDAKATGSALHEPAASNAWLGGFRCHHGHCQHRTVGDVYKFAHSLRGAP